MHVSELYGLVRWVDSEVVNAEVVKKYKELAGILNHNVQPNQEKRPFDTQKEELLESLKNIPLYQLTNEQLHFLERLEILPFLGRAAADNVEDLLYRNVLDSATSYAKIRDMIGKLNAGTGRINTIKEGLKDLVDEDTEIPEDKVLVRVNFAGKASISHLSDFKEWGKNWDEIGRGITRSLNLPPQEIEITGATKGSVILELITNPEIAQVIADILLDSLTIVAQVYTIRLAANQLRNSKKDDKDIDKIAKSIDEKAEKELLDKVEKVTQDTFKKLKVEEENESHLKKAIEKFVDFTNKGGLVDIYFYEPEEDEENAEKESKKIQDLKQSVKKIKIAEEEIRLIEHKGSKKD